MNGMESALRVWDTEWKSKNTLPSVEGGDGGSYGVEITASAEEGGRGGRGRLGIFVSSF